MKIALVIVALVSLVLAAPTAQVAGEVAENILDLTDNILFNISLPTFTLRRDAQDPPELDWTSDGCTGAPNNPFGFPFLPACHRHDFGYQNFRIQKRFTKQNKDRIDLNFRNDMYFQCQQVAAENACQRLADWYFYAVQNWGGRDATKRQEGGLRTQLELAEKAYREAVKDAQSKGLLPAVPEQ